MTTVSVHLDKGVNKDLLPSELGDGWVSDAKNFRFRNGFAEAWGGMSTGPFTNIPAIWMSTYASATTRFMMSASGAVTGALVTARSYSAGYTNITRYTDGAVIASITRVGTTATLTTSTNHGRTTGDSVSVYEAYPSQYNGTYTITVTGATTFTYTMASDPGASASPVGAYSYNVESVFTATTSARWTGGPFNGLFLANNKNDGLYYWSGDTTVRLRKMPDLTMKADAARAFKNFIVLLGITSGGVKYPHRIAWSAAAEPGVIPAFTPSDTNEAGSGVDLAETAGHMVDCLPLGDVNIIYKQDARYAMQYVGGTDIFGFTRLPGNDGLLGVHCVVNTPVGHVFLTNGLDVMVHNGGEARSIAVGRIRNWLVSTVNTKFALAQKVAFLCANPDRDEVWVWIPNSTSNYCVKAAVWNWKSDTWSIFDLTDNVLLSGHEMACACTGLLDPNEYPGTSPQKEIVVATRLMRIAGVDYGAGLINDELGNFNGVAMTRSLERSGIDLGDRDVMKSIHRSRWNIDASSARDGTTVYHGAAMFADVSPTYATGKAYTVGTTDYADSRSTQGRFLAVKLTYETPGAGASVPYTVRTVDLDVRMGGKR